MDGLQVAVGTCTTPGTCTSWAQLSVKLALRFSTNAVIPSLRSLWDKQRGEVWGGLQWPCYHSCHGADPPTHGGKGGVKEALLCPVPLRQCRFKG